MEPLRIAGFCLRVDPPAEGETNMARDRAIWEEAARTGRRLGRIYGWAEPTVTVGRLIPEDSVRHFFASLAARTAAGNGTPPAQEARKWLQAPVVRRPTGGGICLHDADLVICLAWPQQQRPNRRGTLAAYARIHAEIRRILRRGGMPVAMAGGPGGGFSNGICRDSPVAYDLILGGRKIGGGALAWSAGAALYQGFVDGIMTS